MRKQNTPPKEKGNVFDKILKENIKEMIKPLAEELLGTKIISIQPLPAKMQTTLEIESDDFNLIETEDGRKIILHIEFEIKLTDDMIYRVGEYHAVKQRKHKLPIYHYVFYIGTEKKKIRTELKEEEVYKGFNLIRVNEKPPEDYLASDIPEMVLLAILGDYPDERKDEIIRLIITRLQVLAGNKRKLNKYIAQLLIFGRIRKLENIITKNFEEMTSINYDITKDGLYIKGEKKGEARGEKRGEARGEKRGEARGIEKAIKALLLDGTYSQKRIAEILQVPISLVRKVKKELDQNK